MLVARGIDAQIKICLELSITQASLQSTLNSPVLLIAGFCTRFLYGDSLKFMHLGNIERKRNDTS